MTYKIYLYVTWQLYYKWIVAIICQFCIKNYLKNLTDILQSPIHTHIIISHTQKEGKFIFSHNLFKKNWSRQIIISKNVDNVEFALSKLIIFQIHKLFSELHELIYSCKNFCFKSSFNAFANFMLQILNFFLLMFVRLSTLTIINLVFIKKFPVRQFVKEFFHTLFFLLILSYI